MMWRLLNQQHGDRPGAENSHADNAGRVHDSRADMICSFDLPPEVNMQPFEPSTETSPTGMVTSGGRMWCSTQADMTCNYDLPPLPPQLCIQPFKLGSIQLRQPQPPSEPAAFFINSINNNGFINDYAYNYPQQGMNYDRAMESETVDPRLMSTGRLTGRQSNDWPLATSSHYLGDDRCMNFSNAVIDSLPTRDIYLHQSFNPVHERFIQGNTFGAFADQNMNPTPIIASKRNRDGVPITSENTTQLSQSEDNPTDTIPKKRTVGRPPGSKNKHQPHHPKSPYIVIHHIQIGEWQRTSERTCEMFAKCYFGQRKLIWECLSPETKFMNSIIIDWESVSSMKISHNLFQLQVELSKSPAFGYEKISKTKVHGSCVPRDDFTGGEASRHRIHTLVFKSDMFEKFMKHLNASDELRLIIQPSYRFETNNMAQDPNMVEQREKGMPAGAFNVAMHVTHLPSSSGSIPSGAEIFTNIGGTEKAQIDNPPWNDARKRSYSGDPLWENHAAYEVPLSHNIPPELSVSRTSIDDSLDFSSLFIETDFPKDAACEIHFKTD